MSRHFDLAFRKYMSMKLCSGEVGGSSGTGLMFERFFSGSPIFDLAFTKKGFTLSSVPANVFGSTALVTDSQTAVGTLVPLHEFVREEIAGCYAA